MKTVRDYIKELDHVFTSDDLERAFMGYTSQFMEPKDTTELDLPSVEDVKRWFQLFMGFDDNGEKMRADMKQTFFARDYLNTER